jgi:drug/metabolite transporter (DMT)-like permease
MLSVHKRLCAVQQYCCSFCLCLLITVCWRVFEAAVSCCLQVFSIFTGLLLAALGVMPLRKPPSKVSDWAKLAPIVACTVLTMFWGNAAYMHLSMSFIQILKAFTPAVTLLIGACMGVERLRGSLVAAVLLIAVGTG